MCSRTLALLVSAIWLLASCTKGTEPELDAGPDLAVTEDGAAATPEQGAHPGAEAGAKPDGATSPKSDGAPSPKKDAPASPKPDLPGKPDAAVPAPDFGAPAVATKVAAVQYAPGQAANVKSDCAGASEPDVCAMRELVIQARQGGASLIVTPEWIFNKVAEPDPKPGENPAQSASLPSTSMLKQFSLLAAQGKMHVVFSCFTFTGQKPNYTYYNSQIAFGPDGAVLAVHHKFNLFGNEPKLFTAGTDVEVFASPLGPVGLLQCADIYGSTQLRSKLAKTLKARVVAISSEWTVSSPIPSYYVPYAKSWGVYAVVANTTLSPGYGGAIIDPAGKILAQVSKTTPSVLFGDIPLP